MVCQRKFIFSSSKKKVFFIYVFLLNIFTHFIPFERMSLSPDSYSLSSLEYGLKNFFYHSDRPLAYIFIEIQNSIIFENSYLDILLIFFSSLIMSVHHFGIEKNLWKALSSCEANNKILTNSANLKEYLLNKDYVSCEDVSFKFLGISLAGYNIIVSFVLFTLSIIGFRKLKN